MECKYSWTNTPNINERHCEWQKGYNIVHDSRHKQTAYLLHRLFGLLRKYKQIIQSNVANDVADMSLTLSVNEPIVMEQTKSVYTYHLRLCARQIF